MADRATGSALWRPSDDPSQHPNASVPTPAVSTATPERVPDSRFPPLNFDLAPGPPAAGDA